MLYIAENSGLISKAHNSALQLASFSIQQYFIFSNYSSTTTTTTITLTLHHLQAKQVGVTALPEVHVRQLTWRDRYLILATDGVWEMVPSSEAVQIVQEFGDNAHAAANALSTIAQERWLATFKGKQVDDVTAMVIVLPKQDSQR